MRAQNVAKNVDQVCKCPIVAFYQWPDGENRFVELRMRPWTLRPGNGGLRQELPDRPVFPAIPVRAAHRSEPRG